MSPRLTRNKLAERLSLTPGGVKSQVKAVPHSQSHGHHSVKAAVTLPGLLRQNPKMNMDKGALVRAVGTGSKQPAIHRFPFENQPMTIRTTAAITVMGDIPVCTRACHGVAEAGENADRSAGTNVGTNAEKASVKASVKILQAILEDEEITIPDLAKLVGVTTLVGDGAKVHIFCRLENADGSARSTFSEATRIPLFQPASLPGPLGLVQLRRLNR